MEIEKPVDKVLPLVAQAVNKWQLENTEEKIQKEVYKLLDQSRNEIMFKLMGFDNHWGKWELDHCNGRAGESLVSNYLKETQKRALYDWLDSFGQPKINASLQKSLIAIMQREFERTLKESLARRAQQMATEQVDTVLEKLLGSDQVEIYKQLQDLIKGNQTNASQD